MSEGGAMKLEELPFFWTLCITPEETRYFYRKFRQTTHWWKDPYLFHEVFKPAGKNFSCYQIVLKDILPDEKSESVMETEANLSIMIPLTIASTPMNLEAGFFQTFIAFARAVGTVPALCELKLQLRNDMGVSLYWEKTDSIVMKTYAGRIFLRGTRTLYELANGTINKIVYSSIPYKGGETCLVEKEYMGLLKKRSINDFFNLVGKILGIREAFLRYLDNPLIGGEYEP